MSPRSGESNGEDSVGEFEDFFENSLNGYLFSTPGGIIFRSNPRVSGWMGTTPEQIKGKRFSDLLTIGGRILYETHLSPLLRMQGYIEEVMLELKGDDGKRIPVLVNGLEKRDESRRAMMIYYTLFRATDRIRYEQNLREARSIAEVSLSDERMTSALREQFIAVLGHDLRTPLTAISTGIGFLGEVSPLNANGVLLAETIKSSATRMGELINDVMDFARGRLGGGISLTREETLVDAILRHVLDELRTGHPGREIVAEFDLENPINCDPLRLSQLLSNLVGNALSHGRSDGPVRVRARMEPGCFELSVSNTGDPIPADMLERLFQPFTRDEVRPSLQGLGLGLYIASQIANAHGGELNAISTVEETRFTFRMPLHGSDPMGDG
ncbi:MAG: PAS domain-containing sensor histidine kinase [Verrucomicrobiota bacterium]